jgi:alkylhydroperoxidase family enzyme
MVLAVAGLNENTIADLHRRLADGDWSAFRPEERAAFAFARKQAGNPAAVVKEDWQQLAAHFGDARALDVLWWIGRCHYMTHVANAFQLPLENENVFDGFRPEKGPVARP